MIYVYYMCHWCLCLCGGGMCAECMISMCCMPYNGCVYVCVCNTDIVHV